MAGLSGGNGPNCHDYFKLKPGTGLDTDTCYCPYCLHNSKFQDFSTPEQIEYAESIARKDAYDKLVKPNLQNLAKDAKELEKATVGGFIELKVDVKIEDPDFPVSHYHEKSLETNVVCDNCALSFSVYGIFANCPDCARLNALSVLKQSLEVCRKELLLSKEPNLDMQSIEMRQKSSLNNIVSAFDAFGKALRAKYGTIFPQKPKNLFQNWDSLKKITTQKLNLNLSEALDDEPFVSKMFQVRHIYEHGAGVIDQDFVDKVPGFSKKLNRKYTLSFDEIDSFRTKIEAAGTIIYNSLN